MIDAEHPWSEERIRQARLAGTETVLDTGKGADLEPVDPLSPLMEDPVSRWAGRGIEQLLSNYQEIIRTRAIYYPVAYQFERELGRGRQGIVFRVVRQGARGCVTRHAIKLFTPAIYRTVKRYWTDMGRIASQISRLQRVNSPHLLGHDVYEEYNGVGYVQMEAIDGLDLHNFIYGKNLGIVRARSTPEEWAQFSDVIFRFEEGKVRIQPGVALYIMRQALRGLEALHDSGYVQADVKPSNIMLDRLGYIKLVDYGRAVYVDEKVSVLFGSPLYMAPEIHRRERYQIQSDIYSIGLVGLEMLRGEPLVDVSGMSERDLLDYKMKLPDNLHDLLPPHVRRNREFVALLRKFTDPVPSQRFTDAGDAESGSNGLALLHKQLTMLGKDSEYGRDLESYLGKLFPAPGPNRYAHERPGPVR